jgi:DNA-binding transcriptional MerR regulator
VPGHLEREEPATRFLPGNQIPHLVLPPQRQPSGYRVYTRATADRIRMARALQALGFTLEEVIDALHAHDSGTATCDSQRRRLEAVLDRIDARIAELRRVRRATQQTLADCHAGRCRLTYLPGPASPPAAQTTEHQSRATT